MKILLAVDGSDYTNRMLSYLLSHKEWANAGHAFTAFHAVMPVPHRAAAFAGPDLVHGYYEDDARMVLEPVRAWFAGHDIQARFEHRIGHPATEIAAFAQAGKFDLLVMGSHGHGTLANLVLGSVATKVLAACTVPVLLVR
ncbi:nucleotide-binding universal stress UspA family protein [Variovorax boronicumulans]|uniref:universal stress protein n=1 Tax=Variovorax boronicumulans TaxID=436515 RepID=UPI0024764B6E|nr:universal stress protein [Variovorax boronicumulans]MDH6169135.1 nucleotide-binding universal stress UspA family protein [Variovorax boronicumulans]